MRDVFGLINNLKEVRKCKVCLILNDEELEQGQAEFRKYLERVVDIMLKFTPTPEECARIALPGKAESDNLLAEYCVKLRVKAYGVDLASQPVDDHEVMGSQSEDAAR